MTPFFAVLIFLPVEYTSKSFAEFSMQRVVEYTSPDRVFVSDQLQSGVIIRHLLQAIVNYDETAFQDQEVLPRRPKTYSLGELSRLSEGYPHDTLDPG